MMLSIFNIFYVAQTDETTGCGALSKSSVVLNRGIIWFVNLKNSYVEHRILYNALSKEFAVSFY